MGIPSQDLVPGDADLRIQARKQIDESALTGESLAVEKETEPLKPETSLAERENMALN